MRPSHILLIIILVLFFVDGSLFIHSQRLKEELRSDEHRVRTETRKLVERHKLNMKVTEAEWQFDKNKLIIYFTAERRVDFRALVRDLARTFRTRIGSVMPSWSKKATGC